MTGRRTVADACDGWFRRLYEAQPALPDVLYATGTTIGLVTRAEDEDRFTASTDFRAPRQAFSQPRHRGSLPRSLRSR